MICARCGLECETGVGEWCVPCVTLGYHHTQSIIELAENQKELVRIIKSFPNYHGLLKTISGPSIDGRLDAVYKKASKAKDRLT